MEWRGSSQKPLKKQWREKKKKEETKATTFMYFILYIVFYLTCAQCGVYLLDEIIQDSWVGGGF